MSYPSVSRSASRKAGVADSLAWHCEECERLLGKDCGSGLELRYKEARFLVRGTDYTVIAACPRCSSNNERGRHAREANQSSSTNA
jgi:hypothetical protein